MRHGDGCGRFLGICALGLGLGILIAAIFPVGVLMFLVSFLLIACGIGGSCCEDRGLEVAPSAAWGSADALRHPGINGGNGS